MNVYVAEFIGTAILILLGNGVVANVLLNKSKGNNGGWIVITTAWGLAVMTGAYAGMGKWSSFKSSFNNWFCNGRILYLEFRA